MGQRERERHQVTRLTNTCEGSNGVAVSNANSAPDQWSFINLTGAGATMAFDTSEKHSGSSSMKIHMPAGVVSQAYTSWPAQTSTAVAYSRAYFKFPVLPTGTAPRLLTLLAGSTIGVYLRLSVSSGVMQAYNNAGTLLGATTAALPINSWVRVDCNVTNMNGTTADLAAHFYSGANLETNTPDTNGSIVVTGAAIPSMAVTVRPGISANNTATSDWDYYIDDVAYDNATFIGSSIVSGTVLVDYGGFYRLPTAAERATTITYTGDTTPDANRSGKTGYGYLYAKPGDHWITTTGSISRTLSAGLVWVTD